MLMGLAVTPGSTMFNVSALLATMLPVVPCVPTVAVPEPSALMPIPVLGKIAEISSSPIVGPEGEAAAVPIVIPVVGLPCASIPLVTTGTPRLIVRSGKLIASNIEVSNVSATVYAGVFCVIRATCLFAGKKADNCVANWSGVGAS